jgi:uncharacterized surface protein with fasciclin (FAS1) repeats
MPTKTRTTLAAALALALPLGLAAAASPAGAAQKDVVGTIEAAGDFGTLLAAIKAAGLEGELGGPGPWTVFAPTDKAFAELPPGTVEDLLKPENRDRLRAVLGYHVVRAEWEGKELAGKTKSLSTLQGKDLTVKDTGRIVKVDEASIVAPDMAATNGVVHAIDRVVLPN